MNKVYQFLLLYLVSVLSNPDVITEDPSTWPGHLEPLASRSHLLPVETLDYFPSPTEFFMNYAYAGVPVIFRGGAKSYPAFSKWKDLYLKSLPEAKWSMVAVEINKKENRSLPGRSMPFTEFIERYRNHNEYLVTTLPSFLRSDVLLPPPLLCNRVVDNLINSLLWISGGGSKSVLHIDNVDNINCIFSGRKEFLLLNYTRYKDDVFFDRVEEGAMSVDVDSVDFVMYPSLAKVDFHIASVSAGDCIFLPYKWIHQVNSFDRNIAVNVWWDHKARIVPTKRDCGHMRKGTTLNEVFFQHQALDHGENKRTSHQVTDERDPVSDLVAFLNNSDEGKLTVDQFEDIALHDISHWSHLNKTETVMEELAKLFKLLDDDGDGVLTLKDVDTFKAEENNYPANKVQQQAEVLVDLMDQQIAKEKQYQLAELINSVDSKPARVKKLTGDNEGDILTKSEEQDGTEGIVKEGLFKTTVETEKITMKDEL